MLKLQRVDDVHDLVERQRGGDRQHAAQEQPVRHAARACAPRTATSTPARRSSPTPARSTARTGSPPPRARSGTTARPWRTHPTSARCPRSCWSASTPLTTTTSAVSRQMMTVSRNGSISAAKPCDMGSLVRTVACAIGAEPMPASFANERRGGIPGSARRRRRPPPRPARTRFAHDGGERAGDVREVGAQHDEAGDDVQQAHERR